MSSQPPPWGAPAPPVAAERRRRRPFRTFLKVVAGLFGAFILLAVVLAIVDPAKKTPPSSPAAASAATTAGSTSASTAAAVPTTKPKPVAPIVVVSLTGTGNQSTNPLTIPSGTGEWGIAWAYNCGNFGAQAEFDFTVNQGTQPDMTDFGPDTLGMKGSGEEHYYDTGTFNLQVVTECDWSLKVFRAA